MIPKQKTILLQMDGIKGITLISKEEYDMNNIKKIIAVALTIGAFSSIIPATNFNLATIKVYAADDNELASLKVKTSSGSTIKTYSDDDYKSKNEVDDDEIADGDTCYAKTSSSKIKISTSGQSYVRVFKGTSSSNKGVKTSSSIELSSGNNTIIVRVYSEDPGTVKYSDTSKKIGEYKIKVNYTGSTDEDEEQDDVYLKSLSLSNGDISFLKSTSLYNVSVLESVTEVKITAKPDCDSDEYDDYEVTINGTTVDEDDKFKKTVSLSKGKNEIKISVEDSDENKRTYTVNITRGGTTNTGTPTTTVKADQWVQSNGTWKYNDSTGNPMKNRWFSDKNYGKDYYLQADGSMATGWLMNNNSWYYLGSDGGKKMGWQSVNGTWYYLDSQGIMKTGWIKDINGKYYYLNSNGSMAYNTTISGYKLGANGAWIG